MENFRTFQKVSISFVHSRQNFRGLNIPQPRLPNINLLLGNNGSGKTAMLRAIALACLGPAVRSSGIFPYRLIRRDSKTGTNRVKGNQRSSISATFTPHEQDGTGRQVIESEVVIARQGDLEQLEWVHRDEKTWHPIFSESSDAFFFVGYGATRRVERPQHLDLGGRRTSASARAQRIQGLFEEAHSLIPFNAWLPELKTSNKKRFGEVVEFVNSLMGPGHYRFTGTQEDREFVFEKQGLRVPFPALSDGYRAFLGWVGDLLYHVVTTSPKGKKLIDNNGIVMVDEIDLHLHPEWQMNVLPTLAAALPNIQFIVTSHSPLIVGSLEWMNILLLKPAPSQSSVPERLVWSIHGLDADQVLLSDFFGLESSRAEGKKKQLKRLTLKARGGDAVAAKELLDEMTRGLEDDRVQN
jgi:predicted ATPase